MKLKKYPISYLFTMVTELLHELDLERYTVLDVHSFGYVPESESDHGPAMFVEVFTRGERGEVTGTERHVRWIERDISYQEWGAEPSWNVLE